MDALRYATVNFSLFQFPVGMSNRSYLKYVEQMQANKRLSFNSPWECRIGLTQPLLTSSVLINHPFNSPWECRIGLTKILFLYGKIIG